MKPKSEDISDVFTQEGIDKLERGQILLFEKATFIISKVNKKAGKVYAHRTKQYTKEDIMKIDNGDMELEYYDGTTTNTNA